MVTFHKKVINNGIIGRIQTCICSPDDALFARNMLSLFLLCFIVKRDQVFPIGFRHELQEIHYDNKKTRIAKFIY
jgi:hypothetical protein